MYKKVYYIVKSNLHYYPPCMSQIKMLQDKGVSVTVLYGSSHQVAIDELHNRGIECVELVDPRKESLGKLDKIRNWLMFRQSLTAYLRKIEKETSLLWFGNAETLLPMKGFIEKNYKYIITYLELLDHRRIRLWFLKRMSQRAKAVVTCEETRSYLMKYWFSLDKVPYTMPNKPYAIQIKKHSPVTTQEGKYVLQEVQGHRFIVYQGMFQNVEYLETIAKVLKDCYPDIYFVMMGIDRRGVVKRVKEIYSHTVNVEYIPAPLHLEVTSNAYIGLLFYEPDTLNKAFCAPNKIFEYSRFGLPMIGNDIPGLKNTIGKVGAGLCVPITYTEINEAIQSIIDNYDVYSKRAADFFESVDNTETMAWIIEDVGISHRGTVC